MGGSGDCVVEHRSGDGVVGGSGDCVVEHRCLVKVLWAGASLPHRLWHW